MITEIKLKELYKMSESEITTGMLYFFGFSQYDISKLVNQQALKRIKKGCYLVDKKNKVFSPFKSNTVTITNELKERIDKKLSELNEENIISKLENVTLEEKRHIQNYLFCKPYSFNVITNEDNTVDLFFKPFNRDQNYDVKESIRLAIETFKRSDYNKALYLFKDVIVKLKYPKSSLYRYLAYACMYTDKYDEALLYFDVATKIGVYEGKAYNFERELKEIVRQKNKEQQFNGSETKVEFFKIDNIFDIAYAIYANKGNIDLACEKFELSYEEILLIKILCARVYYQDGNLVKGDLILKQVEKAKNKTPRVKYHFAQTRKNRLFYKNKVDEEGKKLAVILQNKQKFE